VRIVCATVVAVGIAVGGARAQGVSPAPANAGPRVTPAREISLADAAELALGRSEAVTIAKAGVVRARGEVEQAESGWWPQLFANASYVRTLKTQYSALANTFVSGGSSSSNARNVSLCTVQLDSNATAAQRTSALAQVQSCQTGSGFSGINFSQLGFGSPNAYSLGLTFSQTLFSGQVLAASQAASAPRRSAQVELTAQRAQVVYDVAQAYYDAALADELVTIADSTLAQSQRTYEQASLARHVGTQSDFDLLQAQVTRDNQVPTVLQRRNDRDLAYYRLKQLIKVPLDAPLRLTTGIADATALPGGVRVVSLTDSAHTEPSPDPVADTAVEHRSSVREQQLTVIEYEALRRESIYEYLPTLFLQSGYSRVAYPTGGIPGWNDFLSNWTVGVYASVPLFNGFRTRGDVAVANANLMEQRARLDQERELAALDGRTAVANLRQAEATWAATSSSVGQSTRAYQIADLRYREGLSTLLELNQSRISEQQALANRAQAARNLQIARVRLALIRDLPLSTTNASAGASAQQSASQGSPASLTAPQSPYPAAAAPSASTTANPGTYGPPAGTATTAPPVGTSQTGYPTP
jgi:outer membrane protein